MKLLRSVLMIIAVCLLLNAPIFAQILEKECASIYDEFVANRRGPAIEKYLKAVDLGKKYLEKCHKEDAGVTEYVTKEIPKIEKKIKEATTPDTINPVFKRFNSSIPAKNWDEAFLSGNEIILDYPDLVLDVSLVLASIGFELASANPPDDKFNEKTIRFAKLAIQQINDGKLSSNGDWGAFQYTYRTKKCPDGRANSIGWMNYIIGYIMFSRQNQHNESLPYLYQAAQIGCETTKNYEIYRMIGDLYLEESFKSSEKKKDYLAKALNYYQKAFEIASANPKVPKNHKDKLKEKIENLLKLNKQEK